MSNRSGVSQPPSTTARVISALQERISLYSSLSREQHLFSTGGCLSNIDSELREIDTVLATFRQQRNALVPVARFPPEILSLVFHYLAEVEPHNIQNPSEYGDIVTGEVNMGIGWIKATQVCQAWREAALADSQLWTAATTLLGKDWLERILQLGRSQPKQLDLWVDGGFDGAPLTATSDLLDKLAQLHIIGEESDLSYLMGLHAPVLETLHVHSRFREGRYVFPDALFRGTTPHLRDLYVHNMGVSLSAPFISSLTHLSLTIGPADDTILIAFRDLADMLSSLVTLQSFTMQGYSSEILDEDIPTIDGMYIACPQLMNVNVYSPGWFGAFLLMARLQPSPAARMTFATAYPDPQILEGVPILDSFKRRMLDAECSPIRDMRTVEWSGRAPYSWRDTPICHGPGAPFYEKSIVLSAWHDNCPDYLLRDYQGHCEHPPPLPNLQLILGTPKGLGPSIQLDELIPFTAFPAVRCFSVRPVYRMSFNVSFGNGWTELFRVAQTLEWLRADRDVGEELLFGAFNEHPYVFNDARPNSFPETLRTLAMFGVRWDCDWDQLSERTVRYMLNALGGASSISEVLVGTDTHEEGGLGLEWNNVALTAMTRPDWLTPDHEDWDELAYV